MEMSKTSLSFALVTALLAVSLATGSEQPTERYKPTWDSIDSRPLPQWYDDAKFGIFMHWGVFSVPSFGDEWFWNFWKRGIKEYVDFMKKNYPPGFTYADFAPKFTAEFYDPNQWADILKASGAKYVVLTTKHHEGFCNWPTKVSFNWNSQQVGPKRDLVGDLAKAIRNRTDMHFGVYHSLFEWYNPMYLDDKKNGFNTSRFVDSKTMPELYELVNWYKPDVIWSDGDAGPVPYWKSLEFIAWLYNSSPVKDTVVINDRWGKGATCHHGGYYTCNDRFNPGKLMNHKWENCMTIDRGSWGFRREAKLRDYLTIETLISTLASTVSCGGNLLMNIGPTHDGRIVPIFEERLRQMGQWLAVNGEAIYRTKPWSHQNDSVTPGIWYTSKPSSAVPGNTDVYAIVLSWPVSGQLLLASTVPTSHTTVTMLGHGDPLHWSPAAKGGMLIDVPPMAVLPCRWAWVFKLTGLAHPLKFQPYYANFPDV